MRKESERGDQTYRDVSVQRLPVGPHVRLPDVQHVNLGAGHHNPDQGPVLGPGTLSPDC